MRIVMINPSHSRNLPFLRRAGRPLSFMLPVLMTALGTLLEHPAVAQTLTAMVQGTDSFSGFNVPILSGNTLYGTAEGDLPLGESIAYLFAVNTDGTGFTNLYSFRTLSGINSFGAFLTISALSSNALYGTAGVTGFHNYTLIRINTDGSGFTNLHTFEETSTNILGAGTNSDGTWPNGVVLSDKVLYGTAGWGGSSANGTIFKVNTDGTGFTNLYSFTALSAPYDQGGTNGDGANPRANLIFSGHTLYGTTAFGGSFGFGTVFKINTNGSDFTTLSSFSGGSNGAYPQGALLLSGNVLYGTTSGLGANRNSGNGTVFAINTDGTSFKTLYSFTSPVPYYTNGETGFVKSTNTDGAHPSGGLILQGHTLYGTTTFGGNDSGTVFALNTDDNSFTTLYSFSTADRDDFDRTINYDGAYPHGLTLSGNTLYGTTTAGRSNGRGTVFSLAFAPRLTITPGGANMVLSWPTNYAGFDYTGYALQITTNLSPPTAWTTDVPAFVVVNGQYTATNPITDLQHFFRLSR